MRGCNGGYGPRGGCSGVRRGLAAVETIGRGVWLLLWEVTGPGQRGHIGQLVSGLRATLSTACRKRRLAAVVHAVYYSVLNVDDASCCLRRRIALAARRRARLRNVVSHLLRKRPLRCVRKETPFYKVRFTIGPSILVPHPRATRLMS